MSMLITEQDKKTLEMIQTEDTALISTELDGVLVTAIARIAPDGEGGLTVKPLAVIVNEALFEKLRQI